MEVIHITGEPSHGYPDGPPASAWRHVSLIASSDELPMLETGIHTVLYHILLFISVVFVHFGEQAGLVHDDGGL